jgi:hypothetical protein
MRNNPDGAVARLIHLHREAHGRIRSTNAAVLEFRDDRRSDTVDLVACVMKFQVRNGAWRPAHRLAGHAYDKAQQGTRPWIVPEDFLSLWFECGPIDFHEPRVVCAPIQRQLAEHAGVQRTTAGNRRRLPRQLANSGMIFKSHL